MQINCVNIRDNVAFFKRKVPLALGWKDRVAGSIRSVHWETRLKNHVSHLFFHARQQRSPHGPKHRASFNHVQVKHIFNIDQGKFI